MAFAPSEPLVSHFKAPTSWLPMEGLNGVGWERLSLEEAVGPRKQPVLRGSQCWGWPGAGSSISALPPGPSDPEEAHGKEG